MKTKQYPPSTLLNITDKPSLSLMLKGVETIYMYPQHQIKLVDGEFEQTRSGPNWEGDMLTMATCKHLMRTYQTIVPNKTAICGVTNKLEGCNYLLYVGVIDKTFDSNYDLGLYLDEFYPDAYASKVMTHNRLGDIIPPEEFDLKGEERYDNFNFQEPIADHCRYEENDSSGQRKYIRDIEYITKGGRRPKCLIMSPAAVHKKPIYEVTKKLGRSGVVFKGDNAVKEFLDQLEEAL